jgi:hypothetical protein
LAVILISRPKKEGYFLFRFYLRFDLPEFILYFHKPIFTQLDQLPRFADLNECLLEIDLLLLLKPIRDPLDVFQIFF